jgi:hypothetical protein
MVQSGCRVLPLLQLVAAEMLGQLLVHVNARHLCLYEREGLRSFQSEQIVAFLGSGTRQSCMPVLEWMQHAWI